VVSVAGFEGAEFIETRAGHQREPDEVVKRAGVLGRVRASQQLL
jgi:hypothetical protein